MSTSNEDNCRVCGNEADFTCSACHEVSYCSMKHQSEDWPSHQSACRPFRLIQLKGEDREIQGLKAHRNIQRGEIVLEELPLFHFPELPQLIQGQDQDTSQNQNQNRGQALPPKNPHYRPCVTCSLNLAGLPVSSRRCSKCSWPVCSVECEKHPIHAENECRMLGEEKLKFEKEGVDCLVSLRLMGIREKSPGVWSELLSRIETVSDAQVENEGDVQKLKAIGLTDCEIQVMRDSKKILMMSQLQGFRTATSDTVASGVQSQHGVYLYDRATWFVHSCVPNCDWEIGKSPHFKIQVRAATSIKRGELLTVSHLRQRSEQQGETTIRQKYIENRFGEPCQCPRCIDPSELGSFISGIGCSTCRGTDLDLGMETEKTSSNSSSSEGSTEYNKNSGYYLPKHPGDSKGDPDEEWECNHCGRTTTLSEFSGRRDDLAKQVDSLVRRPEEYQKMEEMLKGVVKANKGKFLHPNHWIIRGAIRALVSYIDFHPNPDSEYRKEIVDHCKFLLALDDKISNRGLSFERACFTDTAATFILKSVFILQREALSLTPFEAKALHPWIVDSLQTCIDFCQDTMLYLRDAIPSPKNSIFNVAKCEGMLKCATEMRTRFISVNFISSDQSK